ncbi:TRAP transporter small permease [Brachybacterium sp. FME24]|uniref:TRAP transporter small permease n=1 Tax=Brachybacterium sp. FME24 TaxID=2742605 RepID=UPI001866CE7A|nr:TRAP transporter small permease [Brachybacterium sp. FME24]
MITLKAGLDRALEWVCVGLFVALVATVAWQVFARQVLNSPSGWSEELAKYIFVWLGLFGAALVFGERGHIAVDFLVRKLPRAPQKAFGMLTHALVLAFTALVLVYGGISISQLAWEQTIPALPVTAGHMYLAIPVSGILTLFYCVHHLIAIGADRMAPVEAAQAEVL